VWTRFNLTTLGTLSTQTINTGSIEYDPASEGITFMTRPFERETEVTGPISARLFIASETEDADLFLVVRLFDPDDREVTFMGALDPNTPLAQGWLRASHRELDPRLTTLYQPHHMHRRRLPLVSGETYEVQVEIWPTSIVVPAGYKLGLTVRGNDYRYEGELTDFAKNFHYANRGIGPFIHDDPDDRPADLFGGRVTIHVGGRTDSHLLVPVIPPRGQDLT
jgi:uncharacterized protein